MRIVINKDFEAIELLRSQRQDMCYGGFVPNASISSSDPTLFYKETVSSCARSKTTKRIDLLRMKNCSSASKEIKETL